MILDKEIITNISHWNIEYYKTRGYIDIKCNQKLKIPIEDLPTESNLKINVKCDICGKEKIIAYQKYNKNIRKYNIYTCDSSCSRFKNRMTSFERYGIENFNRIENIKKKYKEKYDKITQEHEERGYINCIKCLENRELSEFLIKNGRYKHVCRLCRNQKCYDNRNASPHIKAWRSILRGFLLRKNKKKVNKTHHLLKYSAEDLKEHMNNLFSDGLSWENYGEWHIDHIVHLTFFKDDTPEHIVNGLTNLRPLKAKINISRHNNLDEDCLNMMMNYETYIKEEYINIYKDKIKNLK